LLAAARTAPDVALIARLFADLQRAARRASLPGWSAPARSDAQHAGRVFEAALYGDDERLHALSGTSGVAAEPFAALAALLPLPFLHACARSVDAAPTSWGEGYCPCCGAWPVFAETCGIERTRYLRCGRCAIAWEAGCLHCPYCAATDHAALGSLRIEDDPRSTIEVCDHCKGYLKVFQTLAPVKAAEVLLADIGTVELDLAAAEYGYRRPAGLGYAFALEDLPG
jgi:FdhE protein